MNTIDMTEENKLAYFAYKTLGGKQNSKNIFGQYLENTDLLKQVLKSEELSYSLLKDRHGQFNKNQKLELINKFFNNKELLEDFISTYEISLSMDEYRIIIPQVVNKFPDIFCKFARMPVISNFEYIKKLKLDKEVEEKLTGLLVMNKLS